MLTGELRNQIDRIWDSFWSGGVSDTFETDLFASLQPGALRGES